MTSILKLSATSLAREIREKRITSCEAVEASLSAIRRWDDIIQAFITVDEEGARDAAKRYDNAGSAVRRGSLYGVPIAIKDLTDTADLRTTYGSTLSEDHVPKSDELSVARLRAAGAIIIGKTNTPEFGFGAVCSNQLRGPTTNPWDPRLTSGGSSGGSAAAVTLGMVPLAQGTDFGGSVRTPASFCGCVGLRPTAGLIPEPSRTLAWSNLATQGILARNVDDAELMLSVMSGPHRHDPISKQLNLSAANTVALKFATSATLNNAFRIDPLVRLAFDEAISSVSAVFSNIEEASINVDGFSEAFKTLRAAESWVKFGDLVTKHENRLTESFVWNVRQGKPITAEAYLKAEKTRSRIYRNFQLFFESHDILILPAASVLPFPNAQLEVWEVDGHKCDSIIDYLACTYLISMVGCPSLVLPAIWINGSIPFGVQLVARPGDEATLLHAGRMLENRARFQHRWPDTSSYEKV